MDTNAKGPRVAGWKARPYVQARLPFRNHNNQLFARWETPLLYVVYSYGDHWPLFIWDGFDWYENEDKVSPTTTKHRSQTHPLMETVKVSRTWLRTMIANRKGNNAQMERLQNDLLAA
jgi:hypothetical protein